MEFIIENWYMALAFIALGVVGTLGVQRFWNLPAASKLQVVKNWLLWAVTEAEVALGAGTGPLKLQYVYDLFIGKFPWAIHLISFEMFKEMVDEALDEMRDLLAKNEDVAALVEAPVEPVGTE